MAHLMIELVTDWTTNIKTKPMIGNGLLKDE